MGIPEGLKAPSAVNLDHLYTVRQDDLRQWLGQLSRDRMEQVCRAAAVALGCD